MQNSAIEIRSVEEFLGFPRILYGDKFDQITVRELLQFIWERSREILMKDI